MAKYTYKDIIIDPYDKRVKVGEKYWVSYAPQICIKKANENEDLEELVNTNPKSNFPFCIERKEKNGGGITYWTCLIKPKESQVKYVPFDLSKKEDRDFLRGKWIRHKKYSTEILIDCFSIDTGKWYVNGYSAQPLFDNFTFLDDSPVGKKVEE